MGEKRFENISDLVHDGLISFYIEKHASNYIAMMAEESNYAESPYVASRTALLARQKRDPAPLPSLPHHHQNSAPELLSSHHQSRVSPPNSIHSSFQRQHQVIQPPVALTSQHSFSYLQQQHQHQSAPSNGNTLTHHETTTSGVSIMMSQMMMDKENRQSFNNPTNGSNMSDTNSSRFTNSLNVAKSNAIFDRFDIMNSEKPHRFKVT